MRSSLTMGEENIVNIKQPKPESRKYEDLINDIERGRVQIPAFQREFVWHIDRTAKLLDSLLKGYPIGTFILWRTDSRLNHHKEIGDYKLEPAPEGGQIEYVLDGQQRIASLFASYKGVKIRKEGERKRTDFKQIYVILDDDIEEDDGQLVTAKPPSRYIGDFETENSQIEDALNSHLISLDGFGIREDDYDTFLQARAERILTELEARLNVN